MKYTYAFLLLIATMQFRNVRCEDDEEEFDDMEDLDEFRESLNSHKSQLQPQLQLPGWCWCWFGFA
jgi:hypothetical protein